MKIRITIALTCLVFGLLFFVASCKKDPQISNSNSGFPEEIQRIFENKCATAGCHNDKSFRNAAGLNLTSWENLVYQGGVSGSVVIPFRPEFSSLFQFINSYEDLGLTAEPQMPINGENLSREEVLLIKDWISKGCQNADGEIPFQNGFAARQKVMISNQGCDVVAIIDPITKLVMRYITVGKESTIEVPHFLNMSADGQFWYACFTEGTVLQKFSSATGQLVGQADIGAGQWNVVQVAPNNNAAYVSDLNNNGRVVKVNTNTMTLEATYQNISGFVFPHGIAIRENTTGGETLFITGQNGNSFYKLNPSVPSFQTFSLVKGQTPNSTPGTYDPHEVIFSPDGTKYFFTCQSSDEVRVFDARTDTLLKVIAVGNLPLEVAISESKNLLFVSCSEEPNPNFAGLKGSVDVIDMNTLTRVRQLFGKFYQPHGMVVNEGRNELFVASRNADPSGPPPHHISECGNRNGYFEVFNLNSWEVVTSPRELSVDPYSAIITK